MSTYTASAFKRKPATAGFLYSLVRLSLDEANQILREIRMFLTVIEDKDDVLSDAA
jgi:hypothetical protein